MVTTEKHRKPFWKSSLLKIISLRLAIALGLMLIALCVFWFIIHEVILEKEDNVDKAVLDFLSHYIHPRLIGFMNAITFLASSKFLIAGYAILIGWQVFVQKNKLIALNVTAIGTTGILLVLVFKKYFHRKRPINPLTDVLQDYSFPSGHTTSGFIFYGLLIYLIWKSNINLSFKYILSLLLFLLTITIGISRIYLRMHYPSDVIAGFSLGLLWLLFAIFCLEKQSQNNLNG